MNWCEEQRQVWIADMLHVYGFINREHLQRKFRISQPQASKDLQTYIRHYPTSISYDVSRKCYERLGYTDKQAADTACRLQNAARNEGCTPAIRQS